MLLVDERIDSGDSLGRAQGLMFVRGLAIYRVPVAESKVEYVGRPLCLDSGHGGRRQGSPREVPVWAGAGAGRARSHPQNIYLVSIHDSLADSSSRGQC